MSRIAKLRPQIVWIPGFRNHMARFLFWQEALVATKVWTPNMDTCVKIQGAFCSTASHFSDLNTLSTTCRLDPVGDVIIHILVTS